VASGRRVDPADGSDAVVLGYPRACRHGAPVINGIPIVVKMAEMAVKLSRALRKPRPDYVQPPIEILKSS
jgi:hypothetical protein